MSSIQQINTIAGSAVNMIIEKSDITFHMINSDINKRLDDHKDIIINNKHSIEKLYTLYGFLDKRIDETNKRIDETNNRLDETNKRIDETNNRLDKRIDETNKRIDEVKDEIKSVNVKLDNIINILLTMKTSN